MPLNEWVKIAESEYRASVSVTNLVFPVSFYCPLGYGYDIAPNQISLLPPEPRVVLFPNGGD